MAKALVLYSGSLASKVALRLAQRVPGLALKVVHFRSPFFLPPEEAEGRMDLPGEGPGYSTKTLKREFLGLGASRDGLPFPCGSCRLVLLSRAARLLKRARFDYVITGEVVDKGGVGLDELLELDFKAGLSGRVVRPLSGRLLPRTMAEQAGDWPAHLLFDIKADEPARLSLLACELGATPGLEARERCALAQPRYAARLQRVLEEGLPTVNTLRLLFFRNFFYFPPDLKVVVALDPKEQSLLQTLFLPSDVRLYFSLPRSPLVLARADWSKRSPSEREEMIVTVAKVALALADLPPGEACELRFRFEWEEETRRLPLSVPQPAEADLMPAGAGVYLAS